MNGLYDPSTARWLAIWLRRLPTDRLHRLSAALADGKDARAVVVYAKTGAAFRLSAVDSHAEQCHLSVGMALADARAIRPDLIAFEAEPDRNAQTLDDVASWCERYTPIVVVDGVDGLFLEVSGCAHFFGDENALLADVRARLKTQGFETSAALAPTPGAAWALAHWKPGTIATANMSEALLSHLPVAALRLDPADSAFLTRVGLKTITQIIRAPRTVLASRAGERAVRRLDQALGCVPEPLTPRRPLPAIMAARRLLEPVFHVDAVLHVIEDLTRDILAALEERAAGLRQGRVTLFAVDGGDRSIQIGASRPERDLRAIMRLFREKLNSMLDGEERMGCEFGFEALRFDVLAFDRIETIATSLVQGQEVECDERMGVLVDVLSARLGADRVTRPGLVDAHQPERASAWRAALKQTARCTRVTRAAKHCSPQRTPDEDAIVRRPLSLFARPQPIEALAIVPDGPPLSFKWRRVGRTIKRTEGPERIAPDWLRGDDERTRDYYRAEDSEGRRYWIFRQGFYGGDEAPKWFIHGRFA